MAKKELIVVADYTEETILSLEEICQGCHIDSNFIIELIEYDIIHSNLKPANEHTFTLSQLKRIKTAHRLQQDLKVNLAGIAVILDLLDELEELRSRMSVIEKHYL